MMHTETSTDLSSCERILAAVAECRRTDAALDALGPDDTDDLGLAAADREARDTLIGLLCGLAPGAAAPAAVVLPDGSLVTYETVGDGLAIVGPGDVVRLDRGERPTVVPFGSAEGDL